MEIKSFLGEKKKVKREKGIAEKRRGKKMLVIGVKRFGRDYRERC